MSGLWDYSKYLTTQGINSDEYRLAFWNKVLQPFSILALVVVAISFVFGPLRSVTMGQRLFTGIMVGVIFRTMQDMLGPASLVFNFPPVLAALVPISLCLMLGFWLLWRKV
jgi:lipopolysaccharide export system permease protein